MAEKVIAVWAAAAGLIALPVSKLLARRRREQYGPETPEEVDAVLRAAGYDPDEVGTRMETAAREALERVRKEHGY